MEDQNILNLLQTKPSDGITLATKQYLSLIKAIIFRIIGHPPQDIEECIAEVFIKLWQSADKIDLSKGNLKIYLCAIARNTAITYTKKQRRTPCFRLKKTI